MWRGSAVVVLPTELHTEYVFLSFLDSLALSSVQCSIYGRLDVIRVTNSLFDSLTVVSPSMCNHLSCMGSVQLLTIGDKVALTPGNVTLSNSDISGG